MPQPKGEPVEREGEHGPGGHLIHTIARPAIHPGLSGFSGRCANGSEGVYATTERAILNFKLLKPVLQLVGNKIPGPFGTGKSEPGSTR